MKTEISQPLVTEYLDVISYLQDYYQWRKSTNKDFSYAYWSEELEFSSRSYIRMIIMGQKKVTKKFADAFVRLNFSSGTEEEYFQCLIKYTQSPNPKERKLFGTKLIQIIRSTTAPEVLEPHADFISNPVLPRLFTLLGLKDIYPTAPHLARLMNVSLAEINLYLGKLQEFGLASTQEVEGETHWLAAPERFKIPDSHGNMNLMKFHEHSLQEAVKAFHQPHKLRKYRSLLLPLSAEELEELYTFLDEFASDQLSRFDAETYQGRRLFQMNLNIHPVTNEVQEELKESL